MEYVFTLKFQLSDEDSDHDEIVERLGAAGCDDALVGVGQPGRIALEFTREALDEIARFAFRVNEGTENIGARRLHTIMERVLDTLSFEAPDLKDKNFNVDADYVRKMLADIVKDQDLSRYIL